MALARSRLELRDLIRSREAYHRLRPGGRPTPPPPPPHLPSLSRAAPTRLPVPSSPAHPVLAVVAVYATAPANETQRTRWLDCSER